MRIDDIVNITDAELVNAGYITEILAFADNLKKVKREYLFISNDKEEIKEAIEKGAYAIIFSDDLEIIDEEIAWIKVESINEALLKLLKYKLLDKTLYVTDEITLNIIKSSNKDKSLIVLDKIKAKFLNGDYVYITSLDRIKNISINKIELLDTANIKVLKTTPFMMEFIFDNIKYNIVFPSLYKNELQKAIQFFDTLKLNFSIKKISLNRFIPQFINNRFEKVQFGKSNKVVIQNIKNDKYFINELNYVFENLKYANVKFYNKENIVNIYNDKFDFAILVDCDIEFKTEKKEENKLF